MSLIKWVTDFIRGGDDPDVVIENETPEEKTKREERLEARRQRAEDRKVKVEARREYRIEKIHALKEKFYAVAAKRKWLVFMIVAAIAAYLIIFKGMGVGGGGGLMEMVKGLF